MLSPVRLAAARAKAFGVHAGHRLAERDAVVDARQVRGRGIQQRDRAYRRRHGVIVEEVLAGHGLPWRRLREEAVERRAPAGAVSTELVWPTSPSESAMFAGALAIV